MRPWRLRVIGLAVLLAASPGLGYGSTPTSDAELGKVADLFLGGCWPVPHDAKTLDLVSRLDEARSPWDALALGIFHLQTRPELALELFLSAGRRFQASGEDAAKGMAWVQEAAALQWLQRREEADGVLKRTEKLLERIDDSLLTAELNTQRANMLYIRGENLASARGLLVEVEVEATASGRCRLERDWLWIRGNVAYELGRTAEARRMRERLVALARQSGDNRMLATAHYNLAITYWSEAPRPGDREQLTSHVASALAAAESSGHEEVRARSLLLLGKLLPRAEGSQILDACREAASASGKICRLGDCLRAMARKAAPEDPDLAQLLWQEALGNMAECSDPWAPIFAWPARLEVNWASLPRPEAISDFEQALSSIENLRDSQRAGSGRVGVFSAWADAYQRFAGYLLQADDPVRRESLERAFAVTERMRARVLLETVAARSGAAEVGLESDGRRQVLARLVEVQVRLLDPRLTGNQRQDLLAELERSELEEERLRQELPTRIPGTRSQFAALVEVEQALQPNEALLSFLLGQWTGIYGEFAGGSWLTISTHQGTRAVRLPDRRKIENGVAVFRGLFPRRDGSTSLLATSLYQQLLEQGLEQLPPEVDHLVLVPDGPLHRLPFEALQNPSDGSALNSRFRMSVAPSATLWLRWRQGALPPTDPTTLVFADPAFMGAQDDSPATLATERGGLLARRAELGRLPFARREARAIRSRLGRSTRVLRAEQASEAALKSEDLQAVSIVHLAAHAVIDGNNPERSAVLLSPGAQGEDGLLQPREISNLDLDGRVIVLSACSSATGNVFRGEGVLSLARAFFQAGAHSVVATLWPLRDDDAARLFSRFYDHLADGRPLAGALRRAQLDRQRAGAPAAAWAGVVVLGDGSVAFAAQRSLPLPAIALIAALTAVGLVLVARSRRSRSG